MSERLPKCPAGKQETYEDLEAAREFDIPNAIVSLLAAVLIMFAFAFFAVATAGTVVILAVEAIGVWRLVSRWPSMKAPLVFAFPMVAVALVTGWSVINTEVRGTRGSLFVLAAISAALGLWVFVGRWAVQYIATSARERRMTVESMTGSES